MTFLDDEEAVRRALRYLESEFGFAAPRVERETALGEACLYLHYDGPAGFVAAGSCEDAPVFEVRLYDRDFKGIKARALDELMAHSAELVALLRLRAPDKAGALDAAEEPAERLALCARYLKEEAADLLRGDFSICASVYALEKEAEARRQDEERRTFEARFGPRRSPSVRFEEQ